MWKLDIWNANKSTLLNTITNTTPGGLSGGFRWQLKPDGDTVQLEFSGRNDRLKLPPRGVVALTVDGQSAFYGIVPDPPSAASPNIEQAQVLGGREALRVTLLDGTVYRQQGVYQIVRDILSRLCPPALAYDPALIGDGSGTDAGPGLDLYYSPTMPLTDALDALAKSAGTTWGVDAQGRVFFGRPSPAALNVAYAGQPWRRLPTQGREAVTQAVLRIVSAPSLPDGGVAQYAFVPATVTTTATHASHALLRAQRAVEPPQGVGLIVPVLPAGTAHYSDYDGAAVMDDNPATYVTIDLTNTQRNLAVRSPVGRVVGVEFDYALPNTQDSPADPFGWTLNHVTADGDAGGMLSPSGGIKTLRAILPPGEGAGGSATWFSDFIIGANLAISPTPSTRLYVYRVRFLVIDETAATRTAESYLHVPSASPAELTLPGLIPPSPTVSVIASPDGDVTGNASLFEYAHTPQEPRTTRVRIGADGQSGAARAIRWAVKAGG